MNALKSRRSALTLAAFIAALVLSPQAYGQASKNELFDAEVERIVLLRSQGRLSLSESARETSLAARAFFPGDSLMHAFYDSIAQDMDRVEKGELTLVRAQELAEARAIRFDSANAERRQQLAAQQQRDAAMRQATEEDRIRSEAIGGALQGIGNAFRNAYGNGTNCSTTRYGNQAFTNCR